MGNQSLELERFVQVKAYLVLAFSKENLFWDQNSLTNYFLGSYHATN